MFRTVSVFVSVSFGYTDVRMPVSPLLLCDAPAAEGPDGEAAWEEATEDTSAWEESDDARGVLCGYNCACMGVNAA